MRADVWRWASLFASGSPLGHETRSGTQSIGLCAEPGQRAIGLGHQFLETRTRALKTERRDKCRFARGGVLARGFAERLGITLNVKQIVGDLERLADRDAVAIDIGERRHIGFSENRAGPTSEADQRTGL